jgi:hypothetical protein
MPRPLANGFSKASFTASTAAIVTAAAAAGVDTAVTNRSSNCLLLLLLLLPKLRSVLLLQLTHALLLPSRLLTS